MRRGGPAGAPPELGDPGGEVAEADGIGVEGLVGVEVDADAVALGDRQDGVGGRLGVGVDVGGAAGQVGAAVEGLVEDASVRGPGVAAQRCADQGHDLHHGQPVARRVVPEGDQRLERRPPRGLVEVHVGAHRGGAVQHEVLEHRPRGVEHLRRRAVGQPGRPGAHRAHEVGVGVGGGVPGTGLVEVGVGLDRRVEHDEAVAVDDLLPRDRGQALRHLGDGPRDRVDAHVGLRSIGQSAADEEGHGTSSETPTLGRTSSASACSCSSICSRPSPGSSGNSTRWSSSSRSIHRPRWSATSS